MTRLWLVLVMFVLFPTVASAMPTIVELTPKAGEQNYFSPCISAKFNNKPRQKFSLTIRPRTKKMRLVKKDQEYTWEFLRSKDTFKPKTRYQVTLVNPDYFVFNGQKTRSISWFFTTGTKAELDENVNDMNFGDFFEKNPLARFTPYENSHFKIEWADEQNITPITLFAIFNAGVNGPPIKEQEREYRRQLRAYKKEALAWIRSNKIDSKTLKIKWIPE